MPETSRRRGRGQRNGSGSFGHGRHPDRSPSPRRISLPTSASGLPELDPVFWRVVDEGLRALALELSEPERAAVDGHVRLLGTWNAQINLTALRTPEQIARNHVLDSLVAVPPIRMLAGNVDSVLDIGSGGGFPGLPLIAALHPRRAVLVESIGKKVRFLDAAALHVRDALAATGTGAPEITVLAERAEDLADEAEHRESWQVVTARAVGTLAEVAELGLPLTAMGGHVVAWKFDSGDRSLAREVDAARRIIGTCGGAAPRIVPLPGANDIGLDGHRLVAIKKVRPTPERYPRQPSERRASR